MMKTTPFYSLALNLFTQTQQNQIQKGLEKYPEPFNPRSWTPEQLLDHALQETVDLTHYLVGLKTLLDDKDKEIKRLKTQLSLARRSNNGLREPYKSPFETLELNLKPPYADLDD